MGATFGGAVGAAVGCEVGEILTTAPTVTVHALKAPPRLCTAAVRPEPSASAVFCRAADGLEPGDTAIWPTNATLMPPSTNLRNAAPDDPPRIPIADHTPPSSIAAPVITEVAVGVGSDALSKEVAVASLRVIAVIEVMVTEVMEPWEAAMTAATNALCNVLLN